ncbi:DNA helicase UvrD [candidate division WOR-3 bacterium]|uniref:DNA helicase UvrD n=1 Tax=candidate division WOR-3 bacterium TaxID=2052148 RepID=A0A9D5KB95_UNCW3|nr:DNA helicase UvrD [candidate division WOR-3 bacterium]MBD3365555.1 DNA helicase UvrD [candidate division WOR-3 bacterium]
MKIIADLHLHSRFSRATSREMRIPQMARMAKLKGIGLLGSTDFTHPGWLDELNRNLIEAGPGLYSYDGVKFILTCEVSNIYTRGGALRRVHHVIYCPSFDAVEKINKFLGRFGTLTSDGRPTLGLDSEAMLEAILSLSPESFIIPAHIWTPWFAMFGSKSGFDTVEECFGKYSKEIFAVETGLSSDPPMNWRLSALDRFTLVSNSDAHSPARMGREANVLDIEPSFFELKDALKQKDPKRMLATIEFFPQEGKYHYDGHRNCEVRLKPSESIEKKNICPVCGKPMTLGVLHRIEDLADRPEGYRPENAIPFYSIIPLAEIIAEAKGMGRDTMGVTKVYEHICNSLDGEFNVLLWANIDEIAKQAGTQIAEGIERMRKGQVKVQEGYDGVFGTVSVFADKKKGGDDEIEEDDREQLSLF